MTHSQWYAKIKRALALADRNPKHALRTLDKLARAVESQILTGVHDWQLAQTLHVKSIVQSNVGDYLEAAKTLTRIAEQYEKELNYQLRALVSAYAAAALELAQVGDRRGAQKVLRRASA